MKDAFSTSELKDLLGKTRQVIEREAKRKGWRYREEPGQGRGGVVKLWLVESMDEQSRIAMGMRQRTALAVIAGGKAFDVPAVQSRSSDSCRPPLAELPPEQLRKAALKADLVRHYLNAKRDAKRKGFKIEEARDAFITLYNTGVAYTAILAELGETSWKTLERWAVTLKQANYDCAALAERYGHHAKASPR